VISQQTARACLKYSTNPRGLPPSAEYFGDVEESDIRITSAADWRDERVQLRILEARSRKAVMKLRTLVQQKTPWKDLNMDCVAVSRAHIEVFLLRTFIETISSTSDSSLLAPLTKLRNLVLSLTKYVNSSSRFTSSIGQ